MPEISVIVPVYKVEPYLNRCVDSILAQSFSDFELILVDDGSPDNCGVICDEYASKDERVHVIHQQNGGLSAARNAGIDWVFANSNSKYISFVDSDDWVHEQYLELLLEGILRYGVNICQGRFIRTDKMNGIPEVGDSILCISPEEHYISYYSAAAWDKLYAKSCWEEIRFPEGQLYEDVAIWYKILFKEERIALVDEILYYYFYNTDGIMRSDWKPDQMAQITGWDEQIAFLRENGYYSAAQVMYSWYIDIVANHFKRVDQSKKLNILEKHKYRKQLMSKMHQIMDDSGKHDRWIYDSVHPYQAWFYWTIMGCINKFRKT